MIRQTVFATLTALFVTPITLAQVKTSLLGSDVKQVCDITDYDKLLTFKGGNPPPAAILILDLTNLDAENKNGKAYLLDDSESVLAAGIESAAATTCGLAVANRDFSNVQKILPSKQIAPQRWIATAGDALWIFVLAPTGADQTVQILEVKRKTHIALDLAELGKLVKGAGFAGAAVNMVGFPYVLQETRADLTVQVASADGKNSQTIFSTKSGPPEHLSISANLPVNTVKQLKLDASNNVTTTEAPKEFLLGLNYNIGDVYEEYDRLDANRIFITGMIKFSKQPLDTVGLGVGYNFGFVSAFTGPIWIRQPKATSSASATALQAVPSQVVPSMGYKAKWRVGVTFDLATAVSWVSSAASGSSGSNKK